MRLTLGKRHAHFGSTRDAPMVVRIKLDSCNSTPGPFAESCSRTTLFVLATPTTSGDWGDLPETHALNLKSSP
jgi:hypothetical protein